MVELLTVLDFHFLIAAIRFYDIVCSPKKCIRSGIPLNIQNVAQLIFVSNFILLFESANLFLLLVEFTSSM